jgi:ABC-2 type transport system permease protein
MIEKNVIALQTVLYKEINRFLRIWTQTLLPPAITIALYFVIFGKLIGSQLNNIHGYSYMQYIVPGLTMMAIMTNAYANTSSSFFGAKFSKSIEEMLVSSMPSYIMLLGYSIGGMLRGLLVGIIVMLISLLFTHLTIQHVFLMLVIAIFSALLFSLAGLINGVFAKRFDDVSFIPTFVLTPLTYLGGIFYSIDQLPPIWQKISLANPILNLVELFKYAILGKAAINLYAGFTLLGTLFIVLFFWALYLLKKGSGLRM